MRTFIRGMGGVVLIVAVLVPIRSAPAQIKTFPDAGADIQQWEGPHGTRTCHDLCGGANCCSST